MRALITEMISEKKMGDSHFGLLDLEYDEMEAKIEDSKIRVGKFFNFFHFLPIDDTFPTQLQRKS